MEKEDIKHLFKEAYHDMATSKDSWKMELAGCVMKDMFNWILEHDEAAAQEIAECFEWNLTYYNFVTEAESKKIVSALKHEDGETGARWNTADIWVVAGEGKKEIPYYNCWALYVTMNMLDSDHRKVIMPLVNNDEAKYAKVIYDMALEKLKDVDRPKFIREYFELTCD